MLPDRLGPKDCPSVVILVRFCQGLATPGKAGYRAFSVQNQCSIQCDMSRGEATHYTIGIFLPQSPFSHINFAFSRVTFFI